MKVTLSNSEVTIKDSLNWGDAEKIQGALLKSAKIGGRATSADSANFEFDPSAMLEAKYVALECLVLEIKDKGEENTKKFNREWMNNLSKQDGDKLYEEVNKISKKDQGTPSN